MWCRIDDHSSVEKWNIGPVVAHTTMTRNATANAQELPASG